MKLLTEIQFDILVFIEEAWLKTGKFPAFSTISSKVGHPQEVVVEAISDPQMKAALDRRGITYLDADRLTAQQIACINLLLNVSDRRDIKEKLKALGIPQTTYYGWKKQSHFMKAYKDAGEKLFGETQVEVNAALVKSALSGDMKAIEYYNKVSGRFNDRRDQQVDLRRVMYSMMESIQKHIQNPETLRAIAYDFEQAMQRENIVGEIEA